MNENKEEEEKNHYKWTPSSTNVKERGKNPGPSLITEICSLQK